jgi:CubicO group peptidase (beta-lactamase class C family)
MRVATSSRSVFAVLAIGVSAATALAQPTPEIAAGYKAGIVSSAVFHAGRALEDIERDELGADPLAAGAGAVTVDREHRTVSVEYEGGEKPRLAVFLEGLGTVILPPGSTLADAASVPRPEAATAAADPATVPWPDGDLIEPHPLPAEVDRARLDAAVERAFTGEQYRPSKTLGVVVVYDGRIVAERYAPSWGVHTQYRSWSSAKSVTSALVGILVGQGKLRVRDPAPIPEWQAAGDPRRAITIEHLLHMSSGLESTGSSTPITYWGGVDTGAEAARGKLEEPPGTRWKYSNHDTLLLVRSMKVAIDDDRAFLAFPRRALLDRIGMRHTFPETDPHGNFVLSSQMYTTPRDLARLGLLYLGDGVWNGERILPEGWVDYTVKPAPARRHGVAPSADWGYGAQFWLIGDDPRVPDDAYTTAGSRGQLSTVVPSRRLVVARMGLDPAAGGKWDQAGFVADLLAAIRPTS